MNKKTEGLTNDEKIDMVIMYLRRIDHRDKLRTWGGFFSGIIRIIPIAIFIWSTVYFVQHGDEVLEKIAATAAKQAASVASESTSSFIEGTGSEDMMNKVKEMMQQR